MNLIELGLTGATLTIFVSLLAVTSMMLGSALEHTGNVMESVRDYNADPSDENMQLMQEDLRASNTYLADLSFVSSEALAGILDAIDISALSDNEKASLAEAKDFFQKTEERDLSDPDVIGINEKIKQILDKIGHIE
ncbi:MAG: hypothetical protein KAT83_00305 [Candidatus Aenigmarchaeota archaeon]|nr:hypothetical protein [Candidatus Aenigmarchaeota archaeon]